MMKHSIGVGPHAQPWPSAPYYDKALLQHGDTRNVEDKYRYWTVDAIKDDMAKTSHELEVAIENWQHDFNIGTIVRNANAFNVRAVHIIGKKHWNRRGAMVTDAYLTIYHHETVDEFVAATKGKVRIAIDNLKGANQLSDTGLPKSVVLVFGGEGPGLSDEMQRACASMVAIEQFGSSRSVNVGVASGILMYKWVEQHSLSKKS